MEAADYIALEERYGAHNYKPLDVVLTSGEGVWVWDVMGNRYLDCLSAYSAVNQGHCHPRLVRVLSEQARRLTLTSRAFRNDQLGHFCAELCQLTGYEKALPMNSGAEAVETAVKAVRRWAHVVKGVPDGKQEIVVCEGNFHGRTITVISFSTEEAYKRGFGPLTPGFVTVPYGDADALAGAITPNTAAVLLEPIQGEAGVVVPPEGYLHEVREICDRHEVLFVADEIQSGLGRTGTLLACEHERVRPDVVTLGKALSGGMYPVSAVLASETVLGREVFPPGSHGSTFGGNPLACAIAREALRILMDEGLPDRAAAMGERFMSGLRRIESSLIKEVRGKGLLIGVQLHEVPGRARGYCEALYHEGILCKDTHEDVIRFAPPLVIDEDTVDWALERIQKVFSETHATA